VLAASLCLLLAPPLAGALSGCGSSGTDAAAPRSTFVGLVSQDAYDGTPSYQDATLARERKLGVDIVRQTFDWAALEPAPGHFALAKTDRFVLAAAKQGIAVLPILFHAPFWATGKRRSPTANVADPPRRPATFAAFARAMVGRYGPSGSLWREHPSVDKVPVRDWQIWNEPNLPGFWSTQPFAWSYLRLLRAARAAIRAADPGARVILAGLPNYSWRALRAIYRAGGRGTFDAVALHPFTGPPRFVMKLIRLARAEMARNGDGRLPVWVTELSWPASAGKRPRPGGFEVTDAGQAARLGEALRRLRDARVRLGIERVYWYTWLSTEKGPGAFDWAGLRRVRGARVASAPALDVYGRWARRLEGCAKVPGDARRCR